MNNQLQMTERQPSITLQSPLEPETRKSSNQIYKRFIKESEIQPQLRQNQGCCQKVMVALDIFTFVPIPQSYPVSTKRSKCGSITLLIVFIGYVIYDFVSFVTDNPPRVNSYNTGINPSQLYPVPNMAIGFIYGPDLNMTLNSASFFTIQGVQVAATQGRDEKTPLGLYDCQNLSWMGNLSSVYQNLSCINTTQAQLEGVLYASNYTLYPRFAINLCNGTIPPPAPCVQDNATLYNMTAGGRIFLFIQQSQSVNFATSKSSQNNEFGSFQFFNYFMVPYIYGRVVITIQPVNYIIYPDYLTSWTTKYITQMNIINNEYQISNVSANNISNMFSISLQLSSQAQTVEVVYSTTIEHVSMWGAFWGVLFGIFAVVFLAYNRNQFYRKRPQWNKFEQKVDELDQQKQMLQRQINQFRPIQPSKTIDQPNIQQEQI